MPQTCSRDGWTSIAPWVVVLTCVGCAEDGFSVMVSDGQNDVNEQETADDSELPPVPPWQHIPTDSNSSLRVYVAGTIAGTQQFVVIDGPDYIHGLRQTPNSMECQLKEGLWLVYCAGMWSVPHLQAVSTAIQGVEHYSGQVQLGLRPFGEWEEIERWCPAYNQEDHQNYAPIWILLDEGTAVEVRSGYLTVEEISEIIEPHLED